MGFYSKIVCIAFYIVKLFVLHFYSKIIRNVIL